jgi:hypothetical protein
MNKIRITNQKIIKQILPTRRQSWARKLIIEEKDFGFVVIEKKHCYWFYSRNSFYSVRNNFGKYKTNERDNNRDIIFPVDSKI